MLQVDENIGGRQDQKNNRLQTKTLAVGLLMLVGCFAVGYFNAGTTTTANTRGVASPNVAGLEREIIALKEDFTSTGDALCQGTGYGSKWTGSSLPKSLTFAQVAQVWNEAIGDDTECQAAVVLSAGESEANAKGDGVKVPVKGESVDPATKEYAFGIWQSLPNWYCGGAGQSDAYPSCTTKGLYNHALSGFPAAGLDLRDPCKQAYLTAQINVQNCGAYPFKPHYRHGPIPGAGNFCNGGWTGDLPNLNGGQTCTSAQKAAGGMPCPPKTGLCPCKYWCDDKPYYTNNPAFLNNLGGSNGAKEACGANSPSPLVGWCEGSGPSPSPPSPGTNCLICGTTAGVGGWFTTYCDQKCDGTSAGCSDPTGQSQAMSCFTAPSGKCGCP